MEVQNDFPTVKSVLPFRKKRTEKKKKKSELNEENKHNTKHRKLGIIAEYIVSRIKRFEIMGTKFRSKLGRCDMLMILF
jgi:DDE superfamily endonuclease